MADSTKDPYDAGMIPPPDTSAGVMGDFSNPSLQNELTQLHGELRRIAAYLSVCGIGGGVIADGVREVVKQWQQLQSGILDRDARLADYFRENQRLADEAGTLAGTVVLLKKHLYESEAELNRVKGERDAAIRDATELQSIARERLEEER